MADYTLSAKFKAEDAGFSSTVSKLQQNIQGLTTMASAAFGSKIVGAAIDGAKAIGKATVGNYADYEQLTGGIETLFGDAYDTVMANAKKAFKTTGQSANGYMENVTGFSASLIQGLGGDTAKAAEVADMAMTDMADNANKMGTSVESIQNAYQGFAKQNYTMLDNLKLGYGGTKDEMIRLINDSGVLGEKIESLDNVTFDQMIEAIHAVQDNLGITGTTAEEASSTISGSIGMAQAAWDNLLTGLADGTANIPVLVEELLTSLETVATNVIPVIGTVVTNIIASIPLFLEAGIQLIGGLISGIVAAIPSVLAAAGELVNQAISFLATNAPGFLSKGADFVVNLVTGFVQNIPSMIASVQTLGSQAVTKLQQYLPQFLDKGVQFVLRLVNGVMQNYPAALNAFGQLVSQVLAFIMQNLPQFLSKGVEIVGKIANGIIQNLPAILQAIGQVIAQLIRTIVQNAPQFLAKGIELVGKIAAGLIQAVPKLIAAVPSLIRGITGGFKDFNWSEVGSNVINGIKNGISAGIGAIADAARSAASAALNAAKRFLGIASPSKVMRDQVGKYMALGIGEGFEDNVPTKQINKSIASLIDPVDAMAGATRLAQTTMADATTIFEGVTIVIDNTTNLDGAPIYKKVSEYTIKRMGNENRAVLRAQGAY